MSGIAEKIERAKEAQRQALKFAPVHVRATAEFVLKPFMEVIDELAAEIENLKGEKK